MLRHPGAVLSCLADEIEVNIDLLSVVLFLVPPGAFMHLDAFHKLPHQFRRQLRNIRVLVHQFAEAFGVQKRILSISNLVFEHFRLFLFIALHQRLKLPVGEMPQGKFFKRTAEQRFQVFQLPFSLVQLPLLGGQFLFRPALLAAGEPLEQLVPMLPRLDRYPLDLAEYNLPQSRRLDGVGCAVLLMAVVLAAYEGVLTLVSASAPAEVVPGTAAFAIDQSGEHILLSQLGRPPLALSHPLDDLPGVQIDQGLMGPLKTEYLVRRVQTALFALEGWRIGQG